MQVNQMTGIKRSLFSRLTSFLLAAVMLVALVPETALSSLAVSDTGDFKVSLSWNKSEDPQNFTYDSSVEETKMVRLKVSYSNKTVSRTFNPGDITITLNGMKDVVRSGTSAKPTGVAADEEGSSVKNYDWTYSYTAATDTYTFTNNNIIADKSTFEGSFEIIWDLPSRDTKDGITDKEFKAELYTAETKVESEPIYYSQKRKADEYETTQNTSKLNKDKLPEEDYQEFIWINYDIGATDTYYSKDVENDEFFKCYFLEEAQVKSDDLTETGNIVVIDGKNYKEYTAYKNVKANSDSFYLKQVLVAYPRSKFNGKSLVTNYVKLYGKYYEEKPEDYKYDEVSDDKHLLAEQNYEICLGDYDFNDIPGDIYDVQKYSYGVRSDYINRHCNECKGRGAINSIHLYDSKQEYHSNLGINLNFYNQYITNPESYDLEFVDDIFDVQLKSGGMRRLEDDEYHFTKLYIPPNREIRNNNNYFITASASVDPASAVYSVSSGAYAVEIYTRAAYSSDFVKLETPQTKNLKITSSEQTIDLPEDTVAFKIKILDVKEGFNTSSFRCYYKFHTDDTNIDTEGGTMFNNMYFKLNCTYLDNAGNRYEDQPINDYKNADEETLGRLYGENYLNNREYKRDMELYGEPLDREVGKSHILEIPNEFKISKVDFGKDTSVDASGLWNEAYHFKGSITSNFTLGEGTELSNFSVFTVVPKDLRLDENYNDPESLLDALTFSSPDGYSSAEIASHTKITIVDDPNKYDGRQYIRFDFNFEDSPIITNSIKISDIPMYVFRHDLEYGKVNYTMRAAMTVNQPGKWYSDSVDNNNIEDFVWTDIDDDSNTSEPASFASSSYSLTNSENFEMQLTKFVETPLSGGLVNPEGDADISQVPKTYAGGDYSYFLCARVNTGKAKNIILADVIEPSDSSEWQGEFIGLDYSQITRKLEYPDGADKTPTIYYSPEVETFTKLDDDGKTVIDRDAFKTGNWTTTKPDVVRSIAVDFGEGTATSGMDMMLEIKMKAPTDPANYNKRATNSCSVGYNWIEKTDVDKSYPDYLTSNVVPVKYVPMGKIILTKKDAVTGKTITGARFELYKKGGDSQTRLRDVLVGEYETNANGRITVDELAYGTYYFKEITAPTGYQLPETVTEDIIVSNAEPMVKIDYNNERMRGSVTIKKVSDRLPELTLAGAKFKLYHSDGTLVSDNEYVTGDDGTLTITDIEWGKYYIMETEPPAGYKMSTEKYEFEFNAKNVAATKEITVENEQLPATAVLEKYELKDNKYDMPADAGDMTFDEDVPVSGAVYRLYDKDGLLVTTKITDKNGKIYVEDLTFGEYYFEEFTAAIGYEKYPEKIAFEVGPDQTEANLVIKTADARKTGSVWLEKRDDQKEVVKGAGYGLFDSTGNRLCVQAVNAGANDGKYKYVSSGTSAIDMITSPEGVVEIEGLYWGDYYLQETKAPKGYELSDEKFSFTVDANSVLSTQMMNATDDRIKGVVELTKVKENEENITLADAVFNLYRNDGSLYRENLTTDANGKLRVENIDWGSYYFKEIKAPAGYGLNPKNIKFSVNYLTAGKVQEITVTDPAKNYKLTVTKAIKQNEVVFAHGNPTFTFEVENSATHEKYYKTVAFSPENVDLTSDTYAEVSAVFALQMGTYTVSEADADRYTLSGISVDGTPLPNGSTSATVTLDDSNPETGITVKFKNDKIDQSSTSHNSTVANMFSRARKLTAIIADYHGSEIISTETIPTSDLTVYAVYDDGTQATVTGYTLDPETLSYENNGEFDITVSYSEGGVTRKDTFTVTVDVPDMFTAKFVEKQADGTYKTVSDPTEVTIDGTTYRGLVAITGYTGTSSVVNFPASLKGVITTEGGEVQYPSEKFKVVGVEPQIANGLNYINVKNGRNSIKTVKFAEGIEFIGSGAFKQFTGLTSLKLPSTLVNINNEAFYGCKALTGDLNIPATVTRIGDYAFYQCTGFNGSLTFGNGSQLTSIGGYAFGGWWNSDDTPKFTGGLTIPKTVQTIGNNAFCNCGFNGDLTFENDSQIKTIGTYAFYKCGFNGNLTFGNGSQFKTIGDYAFCMCDFIGDLTIPNSVTSIGQQAFRECNFNGDLTFEDGCQLTEIKAQTFRNVPFSGNLNIPEGVKSIGQSAFESTDVKSFDNGTLTLPDSLTSIGKQAFYKCEFTGALNIPSNVTTIEQEAFRNCSFNGKLTFEDGCKLTEIARYTFYEVPFTEGLKIPEGVTSIGDSAFYSNNVTSFSGGNLELPSTLQTIENNAFYHCEFVGKLTIPASVKTIGSNAFALPDWCNQTFTQLEFESGSKLTVIGSNAFKDQTNIAAINLPEGLITIENEAFVRCRRTKTLTLPSTLKTIGNYAFSACEDLDCDLTIPKSVETIGNGAFNGCQKFKDNVLTIPKDNSLKSIGTNAFGSCYFDSALNGSMKSQIWIPIDMSNADDASKGVVCDTVYRYGDNGQNVDSGIIKTSQMTAGGDIFWGYQVKYSFFQRNS